MICGMGLDLLQSAGEFPCAVCHRLGHNSIFCNGCKHWVHKKYSGLKRLTKTLITDVHSARDWTWQAGGGSFLLLPRRHALSSRWLWTFNHNTCENCLEEVQGAFTTSLFPTPLFQDMWTRVQHLCTECNAPCQWDLAIDKAKSPTSAAKWQGCNVKPQDIVTTRSNELLEQLGIEDLDLILKERSLCWKWTCGMLQ